LLWSFLSAISKMSVFLTVHLLIIWQCSMLVHSLCSTGGMCGMLIWYCFTKSGHSLVCPSQCYVLLRMCHSISKNFRPSSLTAVSYCTPMPDSSAWGSVMGIWIRRFFTFGLSIRVSTSRWMYLKWLSYNSLNVGHWSRWLSAALFTASMGGLCYFGRLELSHLPLLKQTNSSILMKMIPCLNSFHCIYISLSTVWSSYKH
jgi:hypothetical protein